MVEVVYQMVVVVVVYQVVVVVVYQVVVVVVVVVYQVYSIKFIHSIARIALMTSAMPPQNNTARLKLCESG